jgi:hypothetical protein
MSGRLARTSMLAALAAAGLLACATAPRADRERSYSALSEAFRASPRIEAVIVRDTWGRSKTVANVEYEISPVPPSVSETTASTLGRLITAAFPDKTVSVTSLEYSHLDKYRQSVERSPRENKILVILGLEARTEYGQDSQGRKTFQVYVYAGMDFYDCDRQAWLAEPGKTNDVGRSMSDLYPASHSLSNCIFELVGSSKGSDFTAKQTAIDQYLQNIEPQMASIFARLGIGHRP